MFQALGNWFMKGINLILWKDIMSSEIIHTYFYNFLTQSERNKFCPLTKVIKDILSLSGYSKPDRAYE